MNEAGVRGVCVVLPPLWSRSRFRFSSGISLSPWRRIGSVWDFSFLFYYYYWSGTFLCRIPVSPLEPSILGVGIICEAEGQTDVGLS